MVHYHVQENQCGSGDESTIPLLKRLNYLQNPQKEDFKSLLNLQPFQLVY